jgi:hypothetical protein
MTSQMTSCVAIHWPSNGQQTKRVPYASNPCPHSHMKRLNVEGRIKLKRKCNVEVKAECVMWKTQIYGLVTNHSPTPVPKQKQMRVLNVKEMESSSNINLRAVSWWMSIKNACKCGALLTTRLSKEGCISLITKGRTSHTTCKHDWSKCGPLQFEKHIPPKWVYQKYET